MRGSRRHPLGARVALALALVLLPLGARAAELDPVPPGLPHAERFRLDNGLTVVLVPNAANPYLDVRLAFRAGGGADPAGKEGLASMLGRMLTTGIPGLGEQALAEELAKLGASIAPDAGMETFELGGEIPTFSDKDVRRLLEIFAAVALTPALPADVLEREKTLRLGLFRRISDNPEALAEIAARLAAFGDGPFGRAGLGTPASIGKLTRDDLVALHAALFNPRHGVLVVGGAFEPKAMRAFIESHFGPPWGVDLVAEPGRLPGRMKRLCAPPVAPCGAVPAKPAICTLEVALICFDNPLASPPPATASGPRTIHVVVDDAGLSQIPFRLVAPNPVAMMDPTWAAFRLGTFVLGGDFTSRLNALLRTKEGLTYGAYFEPDFGGWASGAMAVTTDATPDALAKAVTLAAGEVDALRDTLVPRIELKQSRAMMINAFAFKFETLADTVEQYLTLELAGVPLSWLAGWRGALARPSAEEVRAAMRLVDPRRMTLVVVAPASLSATIASLAHGPVQRIGAKELIDSGFATLGL